jgi:hypothetical protein
MDGIQRTGVDDELGNVIDINSRRCDGMRRLSGNKMHRDATVLPAAGEHTVTTVAVAVQPEGADAAQARCRTSRSNRPNCQR